MKTFILTSATAAAVLGSFTFGGVAMAQQANGSYRQTCRNVQIANGALAGECADNQRRWRYSSLPYTQCRGDISNQNGMLACNGAVASGGAIVGGDNGRPDNGDRGRNTNNDALAAGAVGLVAGAILGNALGQSDNAGPPRPYQPGLAYPAYGDARYGDPRFDPRYAQGGWGYGRRPGEWVPISERDDWLEARIDRALQAGRLERHDARDLRRRLYGLEDLEDQYLRDGRLDGRERADLDRRFEDLAGRIRFETSADGYDNGYRRDDWRR